MKKRKIITLISIIILGVTLIIVNAVMSNNKSEEKGLQKIISSKNYIFLSKDIPLINIENKEIEKLNNQIIKNYYAYSNKENFDYTYNSNIKNNILSLVIESSYFLEGDSKSVNVEIYNINLKNGKAINNQEFLEINKISPYSVTDKINEKFNNYYIIETTENYFDPYECDFECYLNTIGVDIYNDDYKLYSKKDGIYAYKEFYPSLGMSLSDKFNINVNEFQISSN